MTESCPNLVGLVNRMKERCFPDWDEICTNLDLNSHLPKPAPEEAKDNKEASKDEKESDREKEPEEKDLEKEKVKLIISRNIIQGVSWGLQVMTNFTKIV